MASTSENTFLQHALWYHSLGWSVIPLQPKGKDPLIRWKAYQRRRLFPEEIKKWWSIHPNANVGIVTGAISGLVVVDVDSEDVLSLFPAGIPAPEGILIATTGKGVHYYFAHPGGHIPTKAGIGGIKGLDIKGDGGYVVAPPSVHPSGRVYEWVVPPGENPLPPLPTFYQSILRGGSKGEADTVLLDIIRHGVPEGMRNDSAARVVGFYLWLGLSPEETWEQVWAWNQRNSPPLEEEELRGVYDSICSRDEEQHQTTREGRISSQAKRLVEMVQHRVELFYTPEGEPHASFLVERDGRAHLETTPLNGEQFRAWVVREYYHLTGQPVGDQALRDTLKVLDAQARFSDFQRAVHLRVAWYEGDTLSIYIDIGDPHWRQIEVTAEGWRIVEAAKSPVRFRRPAGMLPLPEPQRGGDFQLLRQFTNTPDEEQWALLQGYILGCFLPTDKSHPILVLHGEQGAAKSTVTKLVRRLVDPSVAPLRRPPHDERDLMVAAYNGWVVTMDNVSSIPDWLSDALAALATGGGRSTRRLYTDRGEVLFVGSRPVIINGISELLTRYDLMDRSILVTLPHIPESARRTEWEMEKEFQRVYPLILGGILDTMVEGLRQLPTTQVPNLPRMADFAQWVIACGVGWFEMAYKYNRWETLSAALESDVVWQRVEEFMENHPNGWRGSATELYQNLLLVGGRTIYDIPAKFPSSPNALSTHLRRVAPAMRQEGIEVTFSREGRGGTRRRVIVITRTKGEQTTES